MTCVRVSVEDAPNIAADIGESPAQCPATCKRANDQSYSQGCLTAIARMDRTVEVLARIEDDKKSVRLRRSP